MAWMLRANLHSCAVDTFTMTAIALWLARASWWSICATLSLELRSCDCANVLELVLLRSMGKRAPIRSCSPVEETSGGNRGTNSKRTRMRIKQHHAIDLRRTVRDFLLERE